MLGSGFREAASSCVQVQQSLEGVTLLLDLIYVGMCEEPLAFDSAEGQPKLQATLEALELAHQWQIEHIVRSLSGVLSSKLTEDIFEPVLEMALRLHLAEVVAACQTLASKSPSILHICNTGDISHS